MTEPEQAPEAPLHERAHEWAAPMAPTRQGPLSDVRIIDLTQALAGPFCTMLLADMGADVIKIEAPGGDGLRLVGPHTEVDDEHAFGGYFASCNRNKRSLVLDLKDPDDAATLLALIDGADVVVENMRAGVMDRLGFGWETLRERKPSLVYGAIRGFGDPRSGEGPYTYRPAYDVVAQSMSGFISHTGTKDGQHVSAGPSIGDLYPATMMVNGILAALHHSRATGEGQFVDVGMMDALMALCESMMWRYTYTGEVQQPRGAEHPSMCPFELYQASDGLVAIAAPVEKQWAVLCEVMGRTDLIDDEKWSSARRRVEIREEVREVITAWTSQHTRGEVIEALGHDVPCGPVNNATDLVTDPHVQARGMYVAVDHPGSSRPVLTPNTAVKFSETPGGVYARAPRLGEHNDEIRAELAAEMAQRAEENR